MKKQLINEAFRMQQLAGLKPINSLNENTPGYDSLMDAVDDMFKPGTPENQRLTKAVEDALDSGRLEINQYGVEDAYGQVEMIAKKLGLVNEESYDNPKSKLEAVIQQAWKEDDINKAKNLVANYIKDSKINNDSKKNILNKMKVITDKEKLDYYLANSLLKFEKMGLKETEGSTEHLDELSLRLFIDELGLDSDNPAFMQAYKSKDMQDLMQAVADVAGDGSNEPLDGVFAQSDFITAADNAGFSDEMIEDVLDSDPVRHLERG